MARDITQDIIDGQPKPETVQAFYQALSQAVVAWQRVEGALVEAVKVAIHPELPGAFYAGYYGLQHTAAQLRFADSALHFWFEAHRPHAEAYQAEWETLHKRVDNKLRTRNSLVHFALYIEPQKAREHEKLYLEPHLMDTRYTAASGKPRSRYTMTEIDAAAVSFAELGRQLWNYQRRMIELEARLKASRPP